MRYVIDSRYFDGSCLTSMHDGTHSDYGGETLQELRENAELRKVFEELYA